MVHFPFWRAIEIGVVKRSLELVSFRRPSLHSKLPSSENFYRKVVFYFNFIFDPVREGHESCEKHQSEHPRKKVARKARKIDRGKKREYSRKNSNSRLYSLLEYVLKHFIHI